LGRGDKGSIEDRERSIDKIGWKTSLRGGAFVFRDRNALVNDKFDSGHMATLLDGAHKIKKKAPDHKNLREVLRDGS